MKFDWLASRFRKPAAPPESPPAAVSPPPLANAATPGRLDRINRWLTLGANVGVLAGIILLIVEVHQNAALTRAAMEQQKNDLLVQIELSISRPEMAGVWMKSIHTPEALTDAEVLMIEAHLVAQMMQWDQMLQMEQAGLVTREHVRQHIKNTAPYFFGSRFAKHWWTMQAPSWEGTTMMDVAGPIVGGLSDDFMARYFDSLRIVPLEPAAPQPEESP